MDKINIKRRRVIVSGAVLAGTAIVSAPAFSQPAKVFRIGALNPVTGAGSPYGAVMQKMIFAVAAEINAAGGAGGRKLEVIAEDCQTKPEVAALAVKKLLEVNKVQAVLGTWSSGVTLVAMAQTNAAGAILMNTSGASAISKQNTKGLAWRFQATNERFGGAFYEVVKSKGFKRIATMGLNNPAALSITEGFTKKFVAAGGTLVESIVYEPNRPSYRSELQKVLSAKPDAVVMGSYLPDTSIILREWYQTGQDTRWMIPGFVGATNLVKAVGAEVAEGTMVIDIISNEGSKSLARFNQLYQKTTGKPGSDTYAAMCYDMMMVLALALEAAGPNATTAQINAKIREVSSPGGTPVVTFEEGRNALKHGKISYEGASSKLNFDAIGDAAQDLSVGVIEKGVVVNNGRISA